MSSEHIYMNLIEQRKSASWSITDLRTYLEIIEKLLVSNSGILWQESTISTIAKASPEVGDVIKLLNHTWLLWHAQIKKLIWEIDIDQWWYSVKTSHPDLVKTSLGDLSQVKTQENVWVQVSKWWNIYKRSFDTDVNKLLAK